MVTEQLTNAIPIKKTSDVCGGDACIGNRRITVWQIVEAKRLGFTDDELLDRYDPPLSRSELDAAQQYYEQNRDEIDKAIRYNDAVMFEEVE